MSKMLRKIRVATGVAALGIVGVLATQPASAEGQLNVYNWGDYINPDVLTRFTEDTGIEVTLDTYGTNEEMLAKIQAGATGYDIVFPSVHMRDIMQKLGLLYDAKVNTLQGLREHRSDRQAVPAWTLKAPIACLMPGVRSVSSTTRQRLASLPLGRTSLRCLTRARRSPCSTTCARPSVLPSS